MIIPIIVGLLKWKSLSKGLRLFWGYSLTYVLINGLDFLYLYLVNNYTEAFAKWLEITDYSLFFLLILYQLNNFLFLGYFYSYLLKEEPYGKKVWNISLLLSIVAILAYIIEQGWRNYGIVAPCAEAIYLFAVPLFYLWHLSRVSHSVPSLKNPYFLISIGLAMPNLFGLFLYFVGDAIQAEDFCLFTRLSIAKNCFVILGQVFFIIAFWRSHFAKYIPPNS